MASPSQSKEPNSAWITTPGHEGALVLEIPATWAHRTRSVGGRPTDVKILTDGQDVNLTIMWNAGNAPDFNTPEQVSKAFKAASTPFAANEINANFEIEELSGSQVAGLYTALVNPDLADVTELGPDQYRILTPGIFSVGEFQVFFTMISKEKDSPNRLRVLEMLRGARFEEDTSGRNTVDLPVTVHDGSRRSASASGSSLDLDSDADSAGHDADGHQH